MAWVRGGLRLAFVCALLVACGSTASAPTPDAAVPALTDEVGFLDVPARVDVPYDARLFYPFEAADANVARALLVVFSNGGPGERRFRTARDRALV